MAWNDCGRLLATGSDDTHIMIWSYPDVERRPLVLETQHQHNIFGVRFLPVRARRAGCRCWSLGPRAGPARRALQGDDTRIVSGAMDSQVQLHTLDALPSASQLPLRSGGPHGMRRHPDLAGVAVSARTQVFQCHRSRVKVRGWGVAHPGSPHTHDPPTCRLALRAERRGGGRGQPLSLLERRRGRLRPPV